MRGEVAQAERELPDDDALDARQASIVGHPPRIGPLPRELYPDHEEAALAIATKLKRIGSGQAGAPAMTSLDDVSDAVGMFLRHVALYDRQIELGVQLSIGCALDERDREIAVLRTGWLCRAPFEWSEHVKIGRRVGLTGEQIGWVIEGSSAPGWSRHQRAILRAVEELFADAMISDATWAILAETLDDKQLIELPFLVGQYQMIAYAQNSLRMPLTEGSLGLRAR